MVNRHISLVLLMLVLSTLACTLTRNPPPTFTPIPPTFTPDATGTAIALRPTETPSATPTQSPSITPSVTASPTASNTPTLTQTPLPTSTPLQPILLSADEVAFNDIPDVLRNGLNTAWLSFTLSTELVSETGDGSDTESFQRVYMVNPLTGQRTIAIDLPADVGSRIYWSPTGLHLAYFLPNDGLYLLDIQSGRSTRLIEIDNLLPRGIPGNDPTWSPDGTRLAITLATAYATDIYVINSDGSGFRNITNSPSYDFWPSWSSDSAKLAFVSDRQQCPTWFPNAPDTCDRPDAVAPRAGTLYVYEFALNRVSPITDTRVTAPPAWVNTRLISVSSGSLDPFADESDLWVYDVAAGSTWRVNEADGALYAEPAWRQDGQYVLFQRIASESTVILAERFGTPLNTLRDYTFVRFGLSASWASDNERLVLGGSNGQCPYGLLVLDEDFELINTPSQNLLACDPIYSPNSIYIAYEGIRVARGTDGRLDIYIADRNGNLVRNVSSDLEGALNLLGWVGPTFDSN